MSTFSFPIDPETLIAQRDFARRLATALLGDADAAEDLAQQAWLSTRGQGAAQRWRVLPAVVRNLARNARRGAARRRRREERAARSEALPSATDLLAFEVKRRSIVDAVLALAEPYRGTVLAVYLEGQTPSEVARRLGVPAATVRSRLSRGLGMLRSSLRDDHGAEWRAALLPLALGKVAGGTVLGGVVMTKKLALVVGAGALLAWTGSMLLPDAPRPGALPTLAEAPPMTALAPPTPAAPERNALASRELATADAVARGGSILFADGRPAAGLPYWFASSSTRAGARRVRVPELGPDTPRTASDGSYTRPPEDEAWLWIRVDAAIDVAVAVRGDHLNPDVVLPELATVEVQLFDVPPDDDVDVSLYPSWTEPDGEHVQAVTSVHEQLSGVHLLYVHRSIASAASEDGGPVRLSALAGVSYDVDVQGLHSRFPWEREVIVPPAHLTVAPTGIAPAWRLRVLERDGAARSDLGGFAMLRTDYGTHRGSEVTRFDGGAHTLAVPERPLARLDLQVVLDDGEWFSPTLPGDGSRDITVVRGGGRQPPRLQLPQGRWTTLYLVDAAGVVTLVQPLEVSFYQNVGAVWLERDGAWHVIGAGDAWRRAIAIAADGRVAVCERATDGAVLRALPHGAPLPPLSPAGVAARYPEIRGFWLRFELQPPGLPRGQWLIADRAAFSRETDHGPTTWHKVQTPGVPFRVVLAPDRGAEVELPRWW